MSRYTTKWGTLFGEARVVTVDTRSDSEPQMTTTDLRVTADARLMAEAILLALPDRASPHGPHWTSGFRSEPIHSVATEDKDGAPILAERSLDLAEAVIRLDAALPRARSVVIDGGNLIGAAATHFTVENPLDQIYPWEFWSIGIGVPIAIGAALGRPDHLTVAFLGDGALMLGLSDLDAAVRYLAPLLVIVVDNGTLGAERTSLRSLGLNVDIADVENPDIAWVARSLGFEAHAVSSIPELDVAIENLLTSCVRDMRPCLLSLKVDRTASTPEMDRAFAGYRPI